MSLLSLNQFIESLRRQVAEAEIEETLEQITSYITSAAPRLRDDAILLSSRNNRLRREERKGLISREAAEAERNRLSVAILRLLDEVPRVASQYTTPLRAEATGAHPPTVPQEVRFEKILGINNLKQIHWLQQGIDASKSVCRVLTPAGLGTGFLVAADLMMTNHHVIPSAARAADSTIEFNYQLDYGTQVTSPCRYRLDPARFHTCALLDYTVVGVVSDGRKSDLATWGALCVNPLADPVADEHVVIIQHPNGGPKQIAFTANQVIGLWEHRLHYTTDTMPGSSGAPVFNDFWEVIAIHRAGGELQANAAGDKRFANEGILMSFIRDHAGDIWQPLGRSTPH